MPSTKLILNIPDPCAEVWDQMQAAEGGRHCISCAKTVMDFSACSDSELIRFFSQKSNANTCCRLREDQMNRELQSLPVKSCWKKYRLRAAALLLAVNAISSQVIAQKTKRVQASAQNPKHQNGQKILKGQLSAFAGAKPPGGLSFLIQITAIDSIRVTTDSSGYFYCQLPRGFKEGTLTWREQEAGDGSIMPDAISISRKEMPDMLRVFWKGIAIMPTVEIQVSQNTGTFTGLIPSSGTDTPQKKSLIKRVTSGFRKKQKE